MYRNAKILGRKKATSAKGYFTYFVEYLKDNPFVEGHEVSTCFSKEAYDVGREVIVHTFKAKTGDSWLSFICK